MARSNLKEISQGVESAMSDGKYLLRKGLSIAGRRYSAGTVVERVGGAWRVRTGLEEPYALETSESSLLLSDAMVCRGSFEGISLYVVECGDDHHLHAHGLSLLDSYRTDKFTVMGASLEPGESIVCVRFGSCFFPLEFFQW